MVGVVTLNYKQRNSQVLALLFHICLVLSTDVYESQPFFSSLVLWFFGVGRVWGLVG